jgi:mannose-6-phosphate isomerase
VNSLPYQISPVFKERIWGRRDLSPLFPMGPPEPIGEVWFPAETALLVKLIFTSQRLSVQVHPDDVYAAAHHQSLGKTEAWYIVSADPGAEVAVGFREHLSPDRAREAAQSGEIEDLLAWRRVKAGDVIFVPAGTVHAIGAGLTICEVQENSDITYRLYDYGRPRELHLEHGMAVAKLEPYSLGSASRPLATGRDLLVECPYFRIERLRPQASITVNAGLPSHAILICLRGEGIIAGQPFAPGQGWFVPKHNDQFSITGAASEWIAAYNADQSLTGIQVS